MNKDRLNKKALMEAFGWSEEEYQKKMWSPKFIKDINAEVFKVLNNIRELRNEIDKIEDNLVDLKYKMACQDTYLSDIYKVLNMLPEGFSTVGAICTLYLDRQTYKNRCEWYEELLEKYKIEHKKEGSDEK